MHIGTAFHATHPPSSLHAPKAVLSQLGIDPDCAQGKALLALHGDVLCATLQGRHAPLTAHTDGHGALTIERATPAPGETTKRALPAGFHLLAMALATAFPAQSIALLRAARKCEAATRQAHATVHEAYALAKQSCAALPVTTTTTTQTTRITQTAAVTTTTARAEPQRPPSPDLSHQAQAVCHANQRGTAKLAAAIESGDPARVEKVLALAPAVNATLENGATPLQWAVRLGHEPVVKRLLAYALIEPNRAGVDGTTPLHEAAQAGHSAIAKLLLAHPKIHLNPRLSSGTTPFHLAIEHRRLDVARLLCSTGDKLLHTKPVNIHRALGDGSTPLHAACANGDVKAVSWLLKQLAQREIDGQPRDMAKVLNQAMRDGTTLLQLAARSGRRELVKFLLKHQPAADLHRANREGWTPLHHAVDQGHDDLVAYLLKQPNIPMDAQLRSGVSPLLLAIEKQALNMVQRLVAHGANIHLPMRDGVTPLHRACQLGRLDVVQWLLSMPAILHEKGRPRHMPQVLNQPTQWGDTPLKLAAASGHLPLVQWLLQQDRIDPNLADREGMTALHEAARRGHDGIAAALLAQPDIRLNTQRDTEPTPFHLAVEHNHMALAERLLSHGANMHLPKDGGITPLVSVCMSGNLAALKWLLQQPRILLNGAQAIDMPTLLNQTLADGSTLLLVAARAQQWHTVEFLRLQKGVDLHKPDDQGWSLLHVVAQTHRVGLAALLLQHPGVDIHAKAPSGDPLLHLAIMHNQTGMAQLLLDTGANIQQTCNRGYSLLHIACARGLHDSVNWLLKQLAAKPLPGWRPIDMAAALNAATKDGHTPLLLAAGAGHARVVKVLLQQDRLRPDQPDAQGWNALHHAVQANHHEVVDLLLEQTDIDVNVTTASGLTPSFIAIESERLEMATLLQSKGADINRHRADGNTPLHLAVVQHHSDSVWWLLQQPGILPNKTNREGMAPLHVAALQGHINAVELLLNHAQTDVLQQDADGRTVVHCAVSGKNPPAVISELRHLLAPEDFESLCGIADRWNTLAVSVATELGCDDKLVKALQTVVRPGPLPLPPVHADRGWLVLGPGTAPGQAQALVDMGRQSGVRMQAHGDGAAHLSWAGLKQLEIHAGDWVVCQLQGAWNTALQRMMLTLGTGERAPMTDVARLFFEKGASRVLFLGLDASQVAAPLLARFQNDPALPRPSDSPGGHRGLDLTIVGNPGGTTTPSHTEAAALWFQDGVAQRQTPGAGGALRANATRPLVVLQWNATQMRWMVAQQPALVMPVTGALSLRKRPARTVSS